MASLSNELPEGALDAMIARERGRVIQPLVEWPTLSVLLHEEGVIGAPVSGTPQRARSGLAWGAPWYRSGLAHTGARLFAGSALLAVGVLVGRLVTVASVGSGAGQSLGVRGTVSEKTVAANPSAFRSPDEARRVLAQAQEEYQRAVVYLAASDSAGRAVGDPALYRERLAALDKVVSATQRALKEAPQDPLLNHYYLSTMSAREATVQQLNQTLPIGSRVSHF